MVQYIFIYENIIVGGAELLLRRLSGLCVKKGFEVKVLCRTIDESMLKEFKEASVEVKCIARWNDNKELINCFDRDKEVRIMVFLWDDFVRMYSLNRKNMKTIFYVVHYQGLAVGATCRYPLAKKLIKRAAAKCIYKLLDFGNILCMDNETVMYTANYFADGILDKQERYKILRLPLDIFPVKDEVCEKRADSKAMNILSIARADFPFKAYMFGLVDFMAELEKKGEDNVHLNIISYGEGIEELKSKIDAQSEWVRSKITLIGKTPFEELDKYFDQAKLYIGMGTTILDAAQRKIIAAPVVAYTYQLLTDNFFYENYQLVLDSGKNNMIELYNYVKNLGKEEYTEVGNRSRELVIYNHSIDKNMDRIEQNFDAMKSNRFILGIFIFHCMNKIYITLRRILGKL